MTESSKRELNLETARCFVAYDTQSGEVVHIHEVMREEGGYGDADNGIDAASVRRDALRIFETRRLEVIEVPPGRELKPGVSYRIDPANGELIELSAPPDTFTAFVRQVAPRK